MAKMILTFLQKLRMFPDLLVDEYPQMSKFLHRQGNLLLKKGFGNAPQDQETCFAVEAEKHGFRFLPKGIDPQYDGGYYKYQLHGSQQGIDFMLIEVVDGMSSNVEFELKSGKGMSFYWNDGWFQKDVIYMISYKQKKVNKLYIGYGDESYEADDNLAWHAIRATIKEMNGVAKNTKFLRIYNRLANQHSCKQFTDAFSAERWASVEKRLE